MATKNTSTQIEKQTHYHKIGRLSRPIAKKIHRESAYIYIDDNHLKHIFLKHKNEIENIGLTPRLFVDLVVNNFNRIYRGRRNDLRLVLWNGKPKVTVIELNFALKKEFYEVKTATIVRKDFFSDSDLLWKKK